jgi:hypothetical protein
MSLPPFELVDGRGDAGAMLKDVEVCIRWILREGKEGAARRESLERTLLAFDDPHYTSSGMTVLVEHDDLHALEFVITLLIAEAGLKAGRSTGFLNWLSSVLLDIEDRRGISVVECLRKIDP